MEEVGRALTSTAWVRLAGNARQALVRSRAQRCTRNRRQLGMAGLRRITRSGIVGVRIVAHIIVQECDIGLDITLRYHTVQGTTAQAGNQRAADGDSPRVSQHLTTSVEGDAVAPLQCTERTHTVKGVNKPGQLLPVVLQQLPGAA